MRRRQPGRGRGKTAVLVVLLAVLCIGGAELIACRIAAPQLYERITAPVRALAGRLWQTGRSAVDALSQSLFPAGEEPLEQQLAGDPAIQAPLPLGDPALTKLVERGGRQVLTGGTVELVYFNQGEAPWAEQPYGSDTLDKYGCGPTAMASLVSSLTGEDADPASMAQWAVDNGYWVARSGSALSLVEGAAQAFGLRVESYPDLDAEELRHALSTGSLAVALMGPGHFTGHGHFILLRGVTLEGGVLVADPNSTQRSLVPWDAQLILDELSASRSGGAPLWLVSPAEAP